MVPHIGIFKINRVKVFNPFIVLFQNENEIFTKKELKNIFFVKKYFLGIYIKNCLDQYN